MPDVICSSRGAVYRAGRPLRRELPIRILVVAERLSTLPVLFRTKVRPPDKNLPDHHLTLDLGGLTVPAYAAAKHGVAGLTKALSNEWASKGINVNAIAPGYIDTDMNTALLANPTRSRQILERIPAGKWGKPEDFEGAVVFLASQASGYVSGETIVVDGGWMGR
jgi:NAD(P)-dependent dehydrogenase (short-subunit alcohol dehydrogenase family)